MTANITQQTQVVVIRSGNHYFHAIYRDGVHDRPSAIPRGRAEEIVTSSPTGSMTNGERPDFAHTPCHWQWSVTIEEAAVT